MNRTDNRYAWVIVGVPIAATIGACILTLSGVTANIRYIILACSFANALLVLFDDYQVRESERDYRLIQIQFWWIVVPVYLFERARVLQQPQTLLWAWLSSLITSAVLAYSLGLQW